MSAQNYKYLTEAPDYTWYAGCFGTGTGNLAGYWDRHGMTNFYSGPTGGGLAPLNSSGANANIRALWTSKAGMDGRPLNQPGHIDDYYTAGDGNAYDQSTAPDPYILAGRPEHAPDCIGDFIGLNQKKWTNMADECDGNIDAYSFVFWDKTGNRRVNYSHTNAGGAYIPDIQSGLKAWARHRGYDADVFTQLSSFNPEKGAGPGFTYADVKGEIEAGYPVLCFLQSTTEFSRNLPGMPRANPEIHGVMIFGYIEDDPNSGLLNGVVIKNSWGGVAELEWDGGNWLGLYPVRGVIGFRPKPKIVSLKRSNGSVTLAWDGPSAQLLDVISGTTTAVHRYQVERTTALNPPNFTPVGSISTTRTITIPDVGQAFYRVKLVK